MNNISAQNLTEKLVDLDQTRINDARKAYAQGDRNASLQAHSQYLNALNNGDINEIVAAHPEKKLDEGEFVRPAVFGGLDGISTSFATLSGAISMGLPASHLIGISIAQIFAGAFSMAFGEYVSSTAERQVALREMKREKWEVDNFPDGERAEMVQIYVQNGMSQTDARTVAETLSKYPKFWVEHMLLHEIGILPPGEDGSAAYKSSIAMFISFLVFGCVPITTYLIFGAFAPPEMFAHHGFSVACVFTILTFFVLGAVKNSVTEQNPWMGGIQMGFQGFVAGSMSYAIGTAVDYNFSVSKSFETSMS